MSLEWNRDRSWWYARVGPDRKTVALRIPVKGTPPPSLKQKGDTAFEVSRALAQAKADSLEEDLLKQHDAESELRRMYEIRNGSKWPEIELCTMFDRYAELPRTKPNWRNTRYGRQVKALFGRFVTFCAKLPKAPTTMSRVSPAMALAFMEADYASGITGKTRNNHLVMLRAAFSQLREKASVYKNPFDGIPPLDEDDSVPRCPFTGLQLIKIRETAKQDEFIYPVFAMAICAAARRATCCLVRRRDVDLTAGIIKIKPDKRGAMVRVPIFTMLYKVLAPRMAMRGRPEDYLFPEQAEVMLRNPDEITDRVKKVLLHAGFADEGDDDLSMSQARTRGLRRASVRSLHSFRTTWVTLALMAGVPETLIQRVTGHKTLEVVLLHYFNPHDAELRAVLDQRMPNAITGGTMASPEKFLARKALIMLDDMNRENWPAVKESLRALFEGERAPPLENCLTA